MGKAALTVVDAEYLAAYLDIVERFCGTGSYSRASVVNEGAKRFSTISLGTAIKEMLGLNAQFGTMVSPGVLRDTLPAERLAKTDEYDDDDEPLRDTAWMPSNVCY